MVPTLCCLTGKKKGIERKSVSHISFPLITVLSLYFSYFPPLSLPSQISIPHSVFINWDGVWGKLIDRYEFHMAECSPTVTHQMEFNTHNGQFSYLSFDTHSFTHPIPRLSQFLFSLLSFHFMLLFSLFLREWKRFRNTERNHIRCETPQNYAQITDFRVGKGLIEHFTQPIIFQMRILWPRKITPHLGTEIRTCHLLLR